jgi:hypothetical protein
LLGSELVLEVLFLSATNLGMHPDCCHRSLSSTAERTVTDEIGRGLEESGLGKYVDVSAKYEIALEAFNLVAQEDFKELGLPLGSRITL